MSGAERMERRAIVEVCWGPQAHRRAVLAPGGSLRVGRTELADLRVAEDEQMSGVHFELSWDGARCSVRDLGSAKGTLLDGEPVTEANVLSGGWIRASETDFSVHFEANTPPPRRDAPTPARVAQRQRALEALRPELAKGSLFALLDAARSDRILSLLREAVDEQSSLYEGTVAETMADVAPYLAHLQAGSRLLDRLVNEGFGHSWGVFFVSRRSLKEVRAHLRKLIYVKREEDDAVLYFRFYDPRVLPLFMPTCSVRQEDELFGPIERFLCEGEDGELLRLARGRSGGEKAAS